MATSTGQLPHAGVRDEPERGASEPFLSTRLLAFPDLLPSPGGWRRGGHSRAAAAPVRPWLRTRPQCPGGGLRPCVAQ